MWNVIGGFVISSITEVFVKEVVKEFKKPGVPSVPHQEAPAKRLKHAKGQVMILDWTPPQKAARPSRAKAGKSGRRVAEKRKAPRRSTSSRQHE
jgi:hypothetical protein